MGTKDIWLPSSAKTGGVALPVGVASEVEQENRQLMEEMEETAAALDYWSRELQAIFNEPYIKVILAKPNTTVLGLKPNYYHIVRVRPGTAAWIHPHETEDGEWRDLDSGIIDTALRADMWNDRTQREVRRAQEKAEKARQAQKIREGQDRAAEFDDRLRHAVNTQISVPRSINA